MKFAIIAAGEGLRLAAEGVKEPKPLVTVGGERLIDRLIRIFMANNADEVDVICNDHTNLVSQHLLYIEENGLHGFPIPLQMHVKNTPSSLHSFYALKPFLGTSPFVLTTVDTVFRENDFKLFVEAVGKAFAEGYDGVMGVTANLEQERPLYVETDEGGVISNFSDKPASSRAYIAAGVYAFTSKVFDSLAASLQRGDVHRRQFLRKLIDDKMRLKALPFSKILDIDHAADIKKAEIFLNE